VSELPIPTNAVVSPTVFSLDCGDALVQAAETRRVEAHTLAIEPSWRTTSVTAEARHIDRMLHSVVPSADDPSKVLAGDSASHRADAGQAWGTLIHGLLEHAMRQKTFTEGDLKRLGSWLTVDEPQLRPVLGLAVKTVLHVSKSDLWNMAKKSDPLVEAPFAFEKNPK